MTYLIWNVTPSESKPMDLIASVTSVTARDAVIRLYDGKVFWAEVRR